MDNNNLESKLWQIANDLRGNMDSSEFKNYILGLMFYKFLSEKIENYSNELLKTDNITFEEAYKDEEYASELKVVNTAEIGYFIEPKFLFKTVVDKFSQGEFIIDDLNGAFKQIEDATLGFDSHDDILGLFDDVDLSNNKLGVQQNEKNITIGKILLKLNEINFSDDIDMLGNAYEYLLKMFASDAGKKGGEFYTPGEVSKLVALLATAGKTKVKSIYDPTCGSGSLLIKAYKQIGDDNTQICGQELNTTTYNLARMNMFLHGLDFHKFKILQGDTLKNDKFFDDKFECIVANPPFGTSWEHNSTVETDPRFAKYGKLAPKSKGEYAFIQHMLFHLESEGTMATVAPHGVLFRGAAEGHIRKYIIDEDNTLDAVIGLPSNLFFGTGIPAVILVFKKCRDHDDILFIDASKEFTKVKTQNVLEQEHIDKIYNTYKSREEIDKYSKKVSINEIKENEYNLNIPRYIDTFEEEEEIDIMQVMQELKECREKQKQLIEEINKEFEEIVDKDGKSLIELGIKL